MKQDRETRGVENIALGERALILCDVDEVALEFLTPFSKFLLERGYRLIPRSFRLTGNIVYVADDAVASAVCVARLQEDFYAAQSDWQTPANEAAAALARLARLADVVFLTAMPPRHYEVRRKLLDRHAMPYPMVASENAKGPLAHRLHAGRRHPVIFLDDIARNLHSVREHLPRSLLINLMANVRFRALAPHPGDGVLMAKDWREAEVAILDHIERGAQPG